uniref:Putative plant transposon protein domain-containing protein n=1 Tax=Solanum tuberosum TaxID=4113 RepID=M1DS34_SOLTU
MENNQERDENMATIMTQMDLSTKHVMGGGYKAVNAVTAKSGGNPDDAQFEAMYNEKVQFFSNQAGGSNPSYPKLGGNQGWNKDHDDGCNLIFGGNWKLGELKSTWRFVEWLGELDIARLLDQLNGRVSVEFTRLMSIRRITEWIGGVNEPHQVRLKLKGLRKKAKGVVIAAEVTPPRATSHKPPQGSLKGKGKKQVVASSNLSSKSSDNMGIDSTHLTSSKFEREEVARSRTLVHSPTCKGGLLKQRRAELRSKAVDDPLARLPAPPTPATVQAPQVPPTPVHPRRSINRLKASGLQTSLEEKQLSTDGMVDNYPDVWETLCFHKFHQFTKPRNPYVPSWVQEFYESYARLFLNGKKKVGLIESVDYVEVRRKKVKCSETDINDLLDCTMRTIKFLADMVKTKTLDDLKGWFALLLSGTTPP